MSVNINIYFKKFIYLFQRERVRTPENPRVGEWQREGPFKQTPLLKRRAPREAQSPSPEIRT